MALYLSAVLALGAVLAPAPAAAYTPSVMFNYTVLDTSPMLSFTSDTGGWNTTFSNSPSYVPGMLGEGDSSHVIAGSSPDLNFDFVGTGVYIYGSATEVVQDGDIGLLIVDQKATSKATAGPGIIASVTGLEYGLHHINFRGLGGTWTITQVDLTMGVQTGEKAITDLRVNKQFTVAGGAGSNFYNWTGQWQPSGTLNGIDGQAALDYPIMNGTNAPVVVAAVPDDTTMVVIRGAVGPHSGLYSTTISPAPPYGPASSTFNATNPWVAPAVMLIANLDPTVKYIVTMNGPSSNSDSGSVALSSMEFYPAKSKDTNADGSSSKGAPIGAIVGGVVGGVVALIIAGIIAWCCIRKRKRAAKARVDPSNFEIDESMAQATPFVGGAHAPRHEQHPLMYGNQLTSEPGEQRRLSGTITDEYTSGNEKRMLSNSSSGYHGGSIPPGALPASTSGDSYTQGLSPSMSQGPRSTSSRPSGHGGPSFAQEVDAGDLELIPPSYNPAWSDSRAAAQADASDGGTSAGPSAAPIFTSAAAHPVAMDAGEELPDHTDAHSITSSVSEMPGYNDEGPRQAEPLPSKFGYQ